MQRWLRFFFFFQAEDGIRDYKVTGVQTCALPISPRRSVAAFSERLLHIPKAEIEPRPRVGRADRFEAVEISHRTLRANVRGVQRPDGREMSVRTWNGEDRDLARALVEHRHVHRIGVTPQAQQRRISGGELTCGETPAVFVHYQPRARTMSRDFLAFDRVEQRGHRFIPRASPRSETTRLAPAACKFRPRIRARDAQTSARRRPRPSRWCRGDRRTRWCSIAGTARRRRPGCPIRGRSPARA